MSLRLLSRSSMPALIAAALGCRLGHAQQSIWYFESKTYQDNVGWSCTVVPDLDGDGVDDVLVGARGTSCTGTSTFEGKAHLLSGATGTSIASWCGASHDEAFGHRVTWVRDIDGGGLPELVVAAFFYLEPTLGPETGRIVLISGETLQPVWQLVGEWPGGRFGSQVANAGDLDGDGFDELLVSAPNYSTLRTGRVYVVSSKTVQVLRVHEGSLEDNYGRALTSIDDADGDGVRDYAICGEDWDSTTFDANGRIDVYSGMSGLLIRTWLGNDELNLEDENLGFNLAAAGDWDGDGAGDLMAFLYDSTKQFNETVRVYSVATGAILAEFADPNDKYSAFGLLGIGLVGDMDGDGWQEFAIGAESDRHEGAGAGRVYLYSSRTKRVLYHLFPEYAGGNFGRSLDGGTDFDGDGTSDLVIGAYAPRNTQPKGGRLTAFSGNDLWLQAEPEAPLVGETVIVDLRGGEPGRLGLIALTAIDGAPLFEPLLIAPLDSNGELQLCADADPAVSGMEFTLMGWAQNRAGRGPLIDSIAATVSVQ